MVKVKYLPLGSVVTVMGGLQKLMLVGRGLNVSDNGETHFFDYAAVPYPMGLVKDKVAYFNHDAVDLVLFYGYDDDDNRIYAELINKYLAEHPEVIRYTPASEEGGEGADDDQASL